MSENSAIIGADADRPLTKKEIAEWMRKKPRTIERYMQAGMPHIKIGAPMFHLPTVKAWLLSNQVGSGQGVN